MLLDTAIGAHYLGENVVSVVNLMMPIEESFFALSLLLGMGACTAAAFEYGKGNLQEVRNHFSSAIISAFTVFVLLAASLLLFRGRVVNILCGDSYLQAYTLSYIKVALLWFVYGNLVSVVLQFVSMTGKPHLSMYGSIAFCVSKAVLNYLFLGFWGFGIEGLGYSSIIASSVTVVVVLPYLLKSPLGFVKCTLRQLARYISSNIHFGKGLITGEISYIAFVFVMNFLVLRYLGEKALFFWSVVIMIFIVCDYASAASQETCLSLGGRLIGEGKPNSYSFVFRRSMLFTSIWTGVCLISILLLPEKTLPFIGAADAQNYSFLLPVVAMTIPVTIGLNLTNLYLVRLISVNKVELYTILLALLYLSVPLVFFTSHFIVPGKEWWSFIALIPLQLALVTVARVPFCSSRVSVQK